MDQKRIDLGGRALELFRVGSCEYAAEVDGKRVPIRYRSIVHEHVDNQRTGAPEGIRDRGGEWVDASTMHLDFDLLTGHRPLEAKVHGDVFRLGYYSSGYMEKDRYGHYDISFRGGVVVIEIELNESNPNPW